MVADGTRVELGEVSPARATDGMSQEITIDQPRSWNPSAIVQNFTGSDRLFHSYAEDTAIVERFRFEAQLRIQEGDSFDRGLINLIGTAQFDAIPDVEFGVALRAVGVNTLSGMSGEGLGDTDHRGSVSVWNSLTQPLLSQSPPVGKVHSSGSLSVTNRRSNA